MTSLLWVYIVGVVYFASGALHKRNYSIANAVAIVFWPIVALIFIGWMIALNRGWTNINW